MPQSYQTRKTLNTSHKNYSYESLPDFEKKAGISLEKIPFSIQILLENLLRFEDNETVTKEDIDVLARWNPKEISDREIQFRPARIVLQDFTGVPAVADLAAMRAALKRLGGDPTKINPLQPADLVIDHSIQVDHAGSATAYKENTRLEFERNKERYEFLKWGQTAFKNFRVVPPATGIVHQVNLEFLAQVAMVGTHAGADFLYPDTLVGTDSHTTMINGLGVIGWGVGGIEAEAAMLGQPITMLIPEVVGFKITGNLPAGTTATDLVLTVTQMLRKKGVVGKFVEFFGPGLFNLSLADRATIANMAPEYGATIGIFPVDQKTVDYLKLTGRTAEAERTEAYYKAQNLWYTKETKDRTYSDLLELDLSSIVPSLAGPSRPQDRVKLTEMASNFLQTLPQLYQKEDTSPDAARKVTVKNSDGKNYELKHGSVVIAAITSCTNTSNPALLLTAGLLAKKACEKGLKSQPWVKTSLAPGSKVVTDYLKNAGLNTYLDQLGFQLVGYGCTTCIGNSGPLSDSISNAITEGKLVVSSVLSGNRNFEGRIHALIRANYLASPPLVVAYAIAGNTQINLTTEPLGLGKDGKPVFLKDIWPTPDEIQKLVLENVNSGLFKNSYADVFAGNEDWKNIQIPQGELYKWDQKSTYIKEPSFFETITKTPPPVTDIVNARVLALLKDSITTDHISPAGNISKNSPAAQYLSQNGVKTEDFNSYGSRRGNHEVMIRGTFANVRLKNQLVNQEGGYTVLFPEKKQTTIYDASMEYQARKTPLIILAGKEYGSGSSRDWAAKGTMLLGVKAVIAESFERIHRSNLIGMGVLPLQFIDSQTATSLGLQGDETFTLTGLAQLKQQSILNVTALKTDGSKVEFKAKNRIDTPNELQYYFHGGILQYVLRQALK